MIAIWNCKSIDMCFHPAINEREREELVCDFFVYNNHNQKKFTFTGKKTFKNLKLIQSSFKAERRRRKRGKKFHAVRKLLKVNLESKKQNILKLLDFVS